MSRVKGREVEERERTDKGRPEEREADKKGSEEGGRKIRCANSCEGEEEGERMKGGREGRERKK